MWVCLKTIATAVLGSLIIVAGLTLADKSLTPIPAPITHDVQQAGRIRELESKLIERDCNLADMIGKYEKLSANASFIAKEWEKERAAREALEATVCSLKANLNRLIRGAIRFPVKPDPTDPEEPERLPPMNLPIPVKP